MNKREIKKQKKGSEKGITLISLVITIIVLIILAAVSINLILGENGLIQRTQKGTHEYEKASIIETVRDNIYAKQIDKLTSGLTGKLTEVEFNEILEKHGTVNGENFKPDGKDYEIPKVEIYNEGFADGTTGNGDGDILREGLKVGDYVNYTPDVANDYFLEAIYSGYSADQAITQESLSWRILRIHEDGTVDLVGNPTASSVYLKGALGYNNGVYILNDLCDKLYSRRNIKARSITIEDFEENLTDTGKATRDEFISSGVQYGYTKTYTSSSNRYYPNLYAQENGSGINTTTVKTDGIEVSAKTSLGLQTPTIETYSQADANGLTVTQTFYSMTINNSNYGDVSSVLNNGVGNYYWIATRFAGISSNDYFYFSLYLASDRILGSGLFTSRSYNGGLEHLYIEKFRPVVSLGSDIRITPCTGTNSSSNTHSIQY